MPASSAVGRQIHDAPAGQLRHHFRVGRQAPGKPLDDGGLAHAGVAQQDGVVGLGLLEDLSHLHHGLARGLADGRAHLGRVGLRQRGQVAAQLAQQALASDRRTLRRLSLARLWPLAPWGDRPGDSGALLELRQPFLGIMACLGNLPQQAG